VISLKNGYNGKVLLTALNHLKNRDISEKNKKTISDFINYLSAEGLTHDRQSKYIYSLVQISKRAKNKDFAKLTKNDIVNIIGEINNSDFSEWTKRDYRIVLKRLIKYIREQEGNTYRPNEYPHEVLWLSSTIKKKDRRKYSKPILTPEDIKNLAEVTLNLRDKAYILFLYESGARIGEVLNIKIGDYKSDKYGALVTLFGKTGERKIRIWSSAPAISNWIKHHPKRGNNNAWLFCSINHSSMGDQGTYFYFNKLLREARSRLMKKGIKLDKPVNPHHFRHSRATELAKKLTEAHLCNYMGWYIGSKEAADYVHVSGDATNKAILAMHGLADDEKEVDKFKPIECPRCGIINSPESKFCSGCSLALDLKNLIEVEKDAKSVGFNVLELLKDPNFVIQFGNQLAEQYKKLQQE
jgi:integrase